MCHAVRCCACGLVTWRGCGQHADQVLAPYPKEARCEGHEDDSRTGLFGWLTRR